MKHFAPPRPTLTLSGMSKKGLSVKNSALSPKVAANSIVLLELCSFLITTITYHVSQT